MIIYPAIDLRGGKVVRLRKGDPERQTVYSNNPVDTALKWIDQGAEWIHMVNLDGAFDFANQNLRILESVARLDIKLQFAGGVRDKNAMRTALDCGASRLMIGTLAVQNPDALLDAVYQFGSDKIGVALDARDGMITTHGWTEQSSRTPLELGSWFRCKGVEHALYTDVTRDGMLSGANIEGTIALAMETELQVIASGGVSDLTEIGHLAKSKVVAGVVVGMALYQKKFSLADALLAVKEGS